MNLFKRWLEIHRLKNLERELLHSMMLADFNGWHVRERELEHEVDEIRERIDELKAVKR